MAGSENVNVTCYLYVKVEIETNQVFNNNNNNSNTKSNFHTAQTDFVGLFERQNQHLFKNSFSIKKRSIRNLFFYLSSNSFARVLSQTSNLVHSSLHLSTRSSRFTSRDLYQRCQSLGNRAKYCYVGPPKINVSNSKSIPALIA